LHLIFNPLRRSLATEIHGLGGCANNLLSSGYPKDFTSSAFAQKRKKLDPPVFSHLPTVIATYFLHGLLLIISFFIGFKLLSKAQSFVN
jgi:hypothetical protein